MNPTNDTAITARIDRQRRQLGRGHGRLQAVDDVPGQLHGVAQRRQRGQDGQQRRQVVDRVEDAGEEELRQEHEREDLVRLALGGEVREDEQPERAAVDRDEEQHRDERQEHDRRQRHARR